MFPFSIQRGDETGGATVYLLGETNSLTDASKTGVLPNIAMFRDERERGQMQQGAGHLVTMTMTMIMIMMIR